MEERRGEERRGAERRGEKRGVIGSVILRSSSTPYNMNT